MGWLQPQGGGNWEASRSVSKAEPTSFPDGLDVEGAGKRGDKDSFKVVFFFFPPENEVNSGDVYCLRGRCSCPGMQKTRKS